MKTTTRRDLVKGLAFGALIVGFDPSNRSWVTSAEAGSAAKLDHLPHLDGVLRRDDEALTAASEDYGRFIHRKPVAVLEPGSVQDIAKVVRFANKHDLRIAVRGHGHSIYGQSLVEGGIVIAMSTLAKAKNLPGARVLADAGCGWGTVLQETLKQGLTPKVIPDYLELSVGGTLSIGGISPTTYQYGAMVDNVEALQVVTGEGRIVTCSRQHRADLFNAVLAGQGQCAVLARAVVKLVAAPPRVRAYSMLYPDVATALSDADRLIDEKRFDGLVNFSFADGNGGHQIVMRGTKYYTPPTTPDDVAMLAGLNFVPGVKQIDDMTYVENFSITTGPFPPLPHPAISVVLPASAATQWIESVLPRLNDSDLGHYSVAQIFTWFSSEFHQPLMRMPTVEEKLVGFALIRYAANAEQVDLMLKANRRLFEETRDLGGTLYPFSAMQLSKADWKKHYGENFKALASAKHCFDPKNVLASGPDIF
jgi:cytokinin dehydrogenase